MDAKDMTGQVLEIEGTQAVCIIQTPTKRIYAAVDDSIVDMTWEEAQEWCKAQFNGKGHCPDRAELMWLFAYYKDKVNNRADWYWTSEKVYNHPTNSWLLLWTIGNIDPDYRPYNYSVRAFYTESLI